MAVLKQHSGSGLVPGSLCQRVSRRCFCGAVWPAGQATSSAPTPAVLPSRPASNLHDTVLEIWSMNKQQLMQMLVDAPPNQAKQILGERLYALIQVEQGPLAGKITSMLLEGLDHSQLLAVINDKSALKGKIKEALAALQAFHTATTAKVLAPEIARTQKTELEVEEAVAEQYKSFVCPIGMIGLELMKQPVTAAGAYLYHEWSTCDSALQGHLDR
jgi:hypothetical protein